MADASVVKKSNKAKAAFLAGAIGAAAMFTPVMRGATEVRDVTYQDKDGAFVLVQARFDRVIRTFDIGNGVKGEVDIEPVSQNNNRYLVTYYASIDGTGKCMLDDLNKEQITKLGREIVNTLSLYKKKENKDIPDSAFVCVGYRKGHPITDLGYVQGQPVAME